MELKRELFSQLDAICPPDTILATNTSSLSVTELSVATWRPGKVIGMHFFNPAPVMKLVEVVRTVVTDPCRRRRRGARRPAGQDRRHDRRQGRLHRQRAAVRLPEPRRPDVRDRYASREDIDAAMRLGCGLPMGPLALMDLIGIDTAYEILETMYRSRATGCTRRAR